MSTAIQFRYSIKEIKDILFSNTAIYDKAPAFTTFIEEICRNEQRSLLDVLQKGSDDSKRDRSNTINYQAHEFKNKISERKISINLPKNNRI